MECWGYDPCPPLKKAPEITVFSSKMTEIEKIDKYDFKFESPNLWRISGNNGVTF